VSKITYVKPTESVTGYYLPDWFSVVIPEATVNMVTNPQIRYVTTGYAAVGAGVVIARDTAKQRRGVASLKITPAAGVASGTYFGVVALTTLLPYTYSLDIYGISGHIYDIYFGTTAGVQTGPATVYTGVGHWQRVAVTYVESSSTDRRLYVVQRSSDTNPFWVDGFQCEQKSYPTTYCDGDMIGFVYNVKEYGWNGTKHNSTSFRLATTRSGGKIVNLKDYGFNLIAVNGLGLSPIENNKLESTVGGSTYVDSIIKEKSFTIIGEVVNDESNGDYRQIQIALDRLENAFSAFITPYKQSLLLKYSDDSGNLEDIYIKCVYDGGLEGSTNNINTVKLSLDFTITDTEGLYIDGDKAKSLALNQTYVMNRLITFAQDGSITGFGTGPDGYVYDIAQDVNGVIYIVGDFSAVNGVAADRIAKCENGTWSALGTGLGNIGYKLCLGSGRLYVTGAFATAGGVAVNHVAYYDLIAGTWNAMAGGVGGAGEFGYALWLDASNAYLYVGGTFVNAGTGGGAVVANNIARYEIATNTWLQLLDGATAGVSGPGATVTDIESNDSINIYVGGTFTAAGGVGASNIARWNIVDILWYPLGSGLNNAVYDMAFSPTMELIVDGPFTDAGGVTCQYMAAWNGSTWRGLFAFIYSIRIAVDSFGLIHCACANWYFTIAPYSNDAYSNAQSIRILNANSDLRAIMINSNGNVLIGGNFTSFVAGYPNLYSSLYNARPSFIIDNISNYLDAGGTAPVICFISYPDKSAITLMRYVRINERSLLYNWSWISNLEDKTLYVARTSTQLKLQIGNQYLHALMNTNNCTKYNDGGNQVDYFWLLNGLDENNTNAGRIYVNIISDGAGFYHVNIYKDSGRSLLVGHTASYNNAGYKVITADNASGLRGYIYILTATGADADIYVDFGLTSCIMVYKNVINSLSQAWRYNG
jgi:hypothetical protein